MPANDNARFRSAVVSTVPLFAILLTYSLVQANIPGVNEPHYLTKARHFWTPTWGAGDLFLESSNPHLVFYATVGWFAAVLPFPVAALIGRVLAYALLAYAWVQLSRSLTGRSSLAVSSAALFLSVATIGNWSGEWLVGGVESKVFAYGFAFLSAARLFEGRLAIAGLFAGCAFSFHPVVGAWFALALSAAVSAHWTAWLPVPAWAGRRIQEWIRAGFLFGIAATPGLIPVVGMLAAGSPSESLEAARYQVTRRLAHHLNPQTFSTFGYALMAVLLVAGCAFWSLQRGRLRPNLQSFLLAVAASVLFAIVGLGLGMQLPESDFAVKLLRFYPFRLADILVPFAVCLIAATWLDCVAPRAIARLTTLGLTVFAIASPAHDRDSSRMTPKAKAAWGDVCWWIRTETPDDALLLAADTRWAFKWFAQRAEFVNHKDCPQDPPAITEFRRRQRLLYDWSTAAMEDKLISVSELDQLHEMSGIDYLVTHHFGAFAEAPVYEDAFFRVYAVGNSKR